MKLVTSQFISLDGVVQAPGGPDEDTEGGFRHGGWSMRWFDPEVMGGAMGEVMADTEALLFGRSTWQTMAGAWPDRAGDPFADRMNEIDKHVVSSTLSTDDLTWNNSHLIGGADPLAAVAALKAREGGSLLVMGSPSLTRALVTAGLVDEYLLMIEPVMLGGGKSIFPTEGDLHALELVSTSVAPTGVIVATYRAAELPPMPEWGA